MSFSRFLAIELDSEKLEWSSADAAHYEAAEIRAVARILEGYRDLQEALDDARVFEGWGERHDGMGMSIYSSAVKEAVACCKSKGLTLSELRAHRDAQRADESSVFCDSMVILATPAGHVSVSREIDGAIALDIAEAFADSHTIGGDNKFPCVISGSLKIIGSNAAQVVVYKVRMSAKEGGIISFRELVR